MLFYKMRLLSNKGPLREHFLKFNKSIATFGPSWNLAQPKTAQCNLEFFVFNVLPILDNILFFYDWIDLKSNKGVCEVRKKTNFPFTFFISSIRFCQKLTDFFLTKKILCVLWCQQICRGHLMASHGFSLYL